MLFLGMEMGPVLPRWLAMTMEVDIEGEVPVTVVEATALEATAPAATGVVGATVGEEATAAAVAAVVARGGAPTPFGEAMLEEEVAEVAAAVLEGFPAVAIEECQGETTEGRVEQDTGGLEGSSEEAAEGAMGVVTLDKEEEVEAIKV